jgi:hypothetical protein
MAEPDQPTNPLHANATRKTARDCALHYTDLVTQPAADGGGVSDDTDSAIGGGT